MKEGKKILTGNAIEKSSLKYKGGKIRAAWEFSGKSRSLSRKVRLFYFDSRTFYLPYFLSAWKIVVTKTLQLRPKFFFVI